MITISSFTSHHFDPYMTTFFLNFLLISSKKNFRNPNGDATPTNRHSIRLDSLKHLGGSSSHFESLPAPSSLQSSLVTSSDHEQQQRNQLKLHLHLEASSSFENASRNDEEEDVIESSDSDGGRIVVESFHSQQQSQFIHHALSSTNNRHRRSLMSDSSSSNINSGGFSRNKSNFKRHLIKRFVVKRNFPNNQLSKSSDEMDDEEDSNELDLSGGPDEGENEDDYTEHDKKKLKALSGQHDRLEEDGDDNESDLEKSMKMYVPYWEAYDTVNQLFLEMSEYYLHAIPFTFSLPERLRN